MDLTNKLKLVETGSTTFETNIVKTSHAINGDMLKYTKADRTDLTNRPFGNLFSSFNLPITDEQKELFTSGGTYYNTAISGVNTDQIIVIEIPKNEYEELVDGKTISFTLPVVSGGTPTPINIYGTYFMDNSQNLDKPNDRYSDSTEAAGYFGITPSGDNDYNSNVVFLFSSYIKNPQFNTGTTWNQWTTANKYNTKNPLADTTAKQFAVLDPNDNINNDTADEVVGIAYLDKGFIVITNPTIVNNFAYSGATSSGYDNILSGSTYTGGTDFTQIFFTSSTLSNSSYTSVKTEYIQNVYAFAMNGEFYESSNPTFLEAYPDGNPNNEPVYITEIGLYNEKMELIAIGKTTEPLPKNKNNVITFNIQLKL